MDAKISEADENKMDEFRKEIEAVFNKYNYAAAHVAIVIKPEDPKWDLTSDRAWLIDDVLFMSNDIKELAEAFTEKKDVSKEDRIKLMDTYHNMLIISNRMGQYHVETYETLKSYIFELTESLGLDNSRIIPLEPDTEYQVFTEARITYTLKYDSKHRYFVKQIDGDATTNVIPEDALSLIGCLQDDGVLFGLQHAPAISTGDKIMFQYYPFNPENGITTDTFLTDTVLDVIKSTNIN